MFKPFILFSLLCAHDITCVKTALCAICRCHWSWGLVTPSGDIDLGQHWLRQSIVAWRHQAINWTNVDLSSLRNSDGSFIRDARAINHWNYFENHLYTILFKSTRGQRGKYYLISLFSDYNFQFECRFCPLTVCNQGSCSRRSDVTYINFLLLSHIKIRYW